MKNKRNYLIAIVFFAVSILVGALVWRYGEDAFLAVLLGGTAGGMAIGPFCRERGTT